MFQMPAHIKQGTAEAIAYFKTKAAKTEDEVLHTMTVDFDMLDGKGRRHGYRIVICHEVITRIPVEDNRSGYSLVDDENLGEWFRVYPQAMKDGKKFGAIPRSYRFRTKAEAMQKAETILSKARKAAAKKV